MVGRGRKNDIKSRLGKRNATTVKPKTGRIRDARDVLKQKVSAKVKLFRIVFRYASMYEPRCQVCCVLSNTLV